MESLLHAVQGFMYPNEIELTHATSARRTVTGIFKDEVRVLGRLLELPPDIVNRQPFPGPGLAIRIIGPVDAEGLATLRAADAVVDEEVRAAGLYEQVWQAFAVLLPVKTVGVMGDERTYENVIAIAPLKAWTA